MRSGKGAARDRRRNRRCEVSRKPRCRILTSRRKCWITSSTTYTTQKTHSGIATSSPNHGSRVPEDTFSPTSISAPYGSWNHGRRRSRIPRHLPHIRPELYLLAAPMPSQLQMRKQVVGSQVSLASCIWRWTITNTSSTSLKSLSSHSTDYRSSSNLSTSLLPPFGSRTFSTLFFDSLSSRTWL